MSDLESRHEDAKREQYEEEQESILPEPCGCELLSGCCGAPPHMATPDVSKDNLVGICAQCRDHCDFESSQEQTWVQIGPTDTYGDNADGNFGVPMRVFRCTECGEELEVVYA
ncbi:hypothetical protein LCGC14_0442870 [marine sediment metagenome]|uniref:Uncharacterized protein n=1 Tax=marine sediment metagenome TaxID=412755 RepID=A0A0F9T3C8_9ZZZZ